MKKLPKALRIIIWITLTIVGLVVLLFAVENQRGARAWHATHDRIVANGLTLDLAELAPDPVPDETNFYTTPLLAGTEFAENEEKSDNLKSLKLLEGRDYDLKKIPSIERKTFGDFTDLAAALELDGGAQAVFDTIEARFGEQLAELESAAKRPNAQTKIDWAANRSFVEMSAIELPHYHTAMHLQRLLQIRALAAIQIGDGQAALDAMRPQIRFVESASREPMLIGNLVAVTHVAMLQPIVWEGLARESWNAQQLRELQAELNQIDLLDHYCRAMQGELCFQIGAIDFLKRGNSREVAQLLSAEDQHGGANFRWWCPTGWFDQNKALAANWVLDSAILPAKNRDLKAMAKAEEWDGSNRYHPYRIIASMMVPALGNISKKIAHRHFMHAMMEEAIAIEIHKQEEGNYPTDFAPKTLDFDGEPLRFSMAPNGRYKFYSIGWNLTDDGGEPVLKENYTKRKRPILEEGDWAWAYPDS